MKFIKTSDKKKILKAVGKKRWIGQREPKICMTEISCWKRMQLRRQQSNNFKVEQKKTVNLEYMPSKIPFKKESKIQTFSDI